jgi:hypothetical protein
MDINNILLIVVLVGTIVWFGYIEPRITRREKEARRRHLAYVDYAIEHGLVRET